MGNFVITKLERVALILTLTILLLSVVSVLALVVGSLHDVGSSAINYYQYSDKQKAACLALAETLTAKVIWRDETVLGFGEDGSYGCFLLNDKGEE